MIIHFIIIISLLKLIIDRSIYTVPSSGASVAGASVVEASLAGATEAGTSVSRASVARASAAVASVAGASDVPKNENEIKGHKTSVT